MRSGSGLKMRCLRNGVKLVLSSALVAIFSTGSVMAQQGGVIDPATYTADTVLNWIKANADAKPGFKPGDKLTYKDLEKIRAFVPPGYWELLHFPEWQTTVVNPVAQAPRRDYMDCTEKYGSQVRLAPNGDLANYRCGRPFSNSSLKAEDPQSGLKAAWDYYWRFVNRGWYDINWVMVWTRWGGSHNFSAFDPPMPPPNQYVVGLSWTTPFLTAQEVAKAYGGGGLIQRFADAFYARTQLAHLADLDGNRPGVPGGETLDGMNITYFQTPFDIRGTAFVIYRYSDHQRADDAWAYIPNLRRVRRISAEVKSDSLLGTDITIDDFDGFNDRVLNWNWKFIGWKDVLQINEPTSYVRYYGPNGNIARDVESIKRFAVTIRHPKWPRHPYSAVINFWDPETWAPGFQLCFDRRGKLWKVHEWEYKYSETFKPGFWAETMKGAYAPTWWSVESIDVQNHTSSLARNEGPCMLSFQPHLLAALLDVNSLEQVHR